MSRPPWLSAMSEEWEVVHPKAIFRERSERSRSEDIHLTPSQSHGVLPQTDYMQITGSRVVLNLTGQDNMKHVEPNDFIIHLRSFQGGIEHSTIAGKVSNAYTVLTPAPTIDPRFYKWVLKSSGYIQELNASTNQLRDGQSIKFADFAAIDLPLPPVEEQRRIADFLDDQVARIDAAVGMRRSQVALIEEAHKSWTGEQLQTLEGSGDWDRSTVGRVCHVFFGEAFSSSDFRDDGDIGVIRMGDIGRDAFVNSIARDLVPDSCLVQDGDVVVGMSGRFQIEVWARGLAALNQRVAGLRWDYGGILLAAFLREQLHVLESQLGGTTLANMSGEELQGLMTFVPRDPSVAADLTHKLSMRERQRAELTTKALTGMALLEERKRALITAAVTGELDVTTAKPIGMGKWVPNVGAGLETPAAAQSSGIGGIG